MEAVVAEKGVVLARPVEKGALLATPRATLAGKRMVHFELPRKLKGDGSGAVDMELVGFVLAEAGDVAGFEVGAGVEYRDE